MSKSYHPYTPLESVLSSPSIRVLRAIRFFDWVYADELMVAMDATDTDRDSLSTALSRLVNGRSVLCRVHVRDRFGRGLRPGEQVEQDEGGHQ